MSVKRYEVNGSSSAFENENGSLVDYEDYTALEQKLAESQREFRAADATSENLQMKLEKMAAELQSVKAMNDCLSEELRGYESDGAFEGPKMHLLWWQCETPNHDAFLAEVRARGVEMMAAEADQLMDEFGDDSYKVWLPQIYSVSPMLSPHSFAKECSHEHPY
ncbi:TPA: hypothetical protein OT849_001889 [Enterobacter cloacae]|nr:hypothetical protein [Enterobacter cloacae]